MSMEFIYEERKSLIGYLITGSILFAALSFLAGYAFKGFENVVDNEATRTKLQHCQETLMGSIYGDN